MVLFKGRRSGKLTLQSPPLARLRERDLPRDKERFLGLLETDLLRGLRDSERLRGLMLRPLGLPERAGEWEPAPAILPLQLLPCSRFPRGGVDVEWVECWIGDGDMEV